MIAFPQELEGIEHLGPEAKLDIVRGFVMCYIRDHPDGVPAQEVARSLQISHQTAKKHLDYLVATRQLYAKAYSARNVVYFPNGRLTHPYLTKHIDSGKQQFRLSLLESPRGNYLYLQEIQTVPNVGQSVVGGVLIRREDVDQVLQAVYEILSDDEEREKR